MSNAQEKPKSSIITTASLIILLSTTETPSLLKYTLLVSATISLIITATQLYEAAKAKKNLSNQNKN